MAPTITADARLAKRSPRPFRLVPPADSVRRRLDQTRGSGAREDSSSFVRVDVVSCSRNAAAFRFRPRSSSR